MQFLPGLKFLGLKKKERKEMLSISTAWNYKPEGQLENMLKEIKAVGLNTIELGYRLTVKDLKELIPLLKEMKMQVSSVHNFCPLPDDAPSPRHPSNYYRLSAVENEERQEAVVWTKKAIDTACLTNCFVVVIHAGAVELNNDPTEILRAYKAGHQTPTEFIRMRDEILQEREKNKGHFFEAIIKSLDEITAYARQKRIMLGLETRYYPTEIPNFEEIEYLLKRYDPSVMGYWHDVGHAEVNVRLGIVESHQDYFDRYAKRLIGMHIHGVQGLKDHQAPFAGDFDLKPILPYLKKEVIRVIESHSYASPKEIQDAVKKLNG